MGPEYPDGSWKKKKNSGKNRQFKDTLRQLFGNEEKGVFVDRFDHL